MDSTKYRALDQEDEQEQRFVSSWKLVQHGSYMLTANAVLFVCSLAFILSSAVLRATSEKPRCEKDLFSGCTSSVFPHVTESAH